MKASDVFKSNYIGKDDCAVPIKGSIVSVELGAVKDEDGRMQDKAIMHVSGSDKGMILNVTNWTTLEDAYGKESDDWVGKPVEIYVDPNVMYGGKKIGGVRVRVPAGGATKTAVAEDGPMGPKWADALTKQLADNKLTLDHLRDHLGRIRPGKESTIAGTVETWPKSWAADIKDWIAAETTEVPF